MNEYLDKIMDKLGDLMKVFEGVNQKIEEKFHIKVDVGKIIIGILLVIFAIIVVKLILGNVSKTMYGE